MPIECSRHSSEMYYRGKTFLALHRALTLQRGAARVDTRLSLDTDETETKMAVTYEAVRR